jgi:hypothetical protein
MSAASQLVTVQALIAAEEARLLAEPMEEYSTEGGRRAYRRAKFSETLATLYERERLLLRRTGSRVRVAKLGFAGRSA